MSYLILTNNPIVDKKYENVLYINGSVEDVLTKTRDLVYAGKNLVTHPLPASIRMMFSPYRSVVLNNHKLNTYAFKQEEIVENSISTFKEIVRYRKIDWKNKNDYENLDEWLLKNALKEINIKF